MLYTVKKYYKDFIIVLLSLLIIIQSINYEKQISEIKIEVNKLCELINIYIDLNKNISEVTE